MNSETLLEDITSRQLSPIGDGVASNSDESISLIESKDATYPPTPDNGTFVSDVPGNKNHKSLKELVESFEKLRIELIDLEEQNIEQTIQSKVLDQKRTFIRKFAELSGNFLEINKNIQSNNEMIQKINAELGLDYPLQKIRKFSLFDIDEHILSFAASEREHAALKREHLTKMFEAVKLDISMVLGITTTTAPPSSNCESTKSKDDMIDVEKTLADNASLRIKLDAAQKAQALAEAALDQYKTSSPKPKDVNHEHTASLLANLPYYKITAQFCSRVRHGFHHSGRRIYQNGVVSEIEGRGIANKEVIDLRNDTCHRADITADFALYMIDPNRTGWNIGGDRYIDFTKSYRITPEECKTIFVFSKGSPPPILLDPLNMHATMYRCYFKTAYRSNSQHDKDFEVSFERLFVHYKRLLTTGGISLWTDRHQSLLNHLKSDKNAKTDRKLMETIVQETVASQKAQ